MKRPKGGKPELPMSTASSNPQGDLQARLLFGGLLALTAVLIGGGVFWAGQRLSMAVTHAPIDWLSVGLMFISLIAMVFVLRSLIWMSFFASIMFAAKAGAWQSQEKLCRGAIHLWKVMPGAASTASLVLAQNLLGKNEGDRAIEIAELQWRRSGETAAADQNLALLCATAALAHQLRGGVKESITWNERSLGSFQLVVDQAANPKGLMAKLAASQSKQWIGPLRMHQAVVHLHNANAYFSTMNYRQAKIHFKRAVECANLAPDSAQKKEVLQVAREQLGRLKHA